jgi:hypothetical protein
MCGIIGKLAWENNTVRVSKRHYRQRHTQNDTTHIGVSNDTTGCQPLDLMLSETASSALSSGDTSAVCSINAVPESRTLVVSLARVLLDFRPAVV